MPSSPRQRSVRRTLIFTLIANLLVAAAKLAIGLLTRSLSMVSDGIHSSLDATSNVIGLVGAAIAARPPDEDHPYGHRRFETLASMLIGGVLLLTAWEIVKSSVVRLTSGEEPTISALNFIVMGVTIVINLAVSIYEKREGERHQSELLLADAEHTRSDVYVSLTVVGGLAAVWLGWGWVDAAAALGVVLLIGRAAWRIMRRAVDVLVDTAALDPDMVSDVVADVPGIQTVTRVRSRGPRDAIHLDVDVQVAAPTTAERSESLAREVRTRLRERFNGLRDIQVYFVPTRDEPPDYALIARAEADALGLSVHEVIPSGGENGLSLDMHVEVSPEQSVGEAHKLVTKFEQRLKKQIPHLARIVTHIEPAHTHEDVPLYRPEDAHALASKAMNIADSLYPDKDWHDLEIRPEADGGFALSLHCYVSRNMPVEEAHRIAEVVETEVRAALPRIHRVTIHTEPLDSNL